MGRIYDPNQCPIFGGNLVTGYVNKRDITRNEGALTEVELAANWRPSVDDRMDKEMTLNVKDKLMEIFSAQKRVLKVSVLEYGASVMRNR